MILFIKVKKKIKKCFRTILNLFSFLHSLFFTIMVILLRIGSKSILFVFFFIHKITLKNAHIDFVNII